MIGNDVCHKTLGLVGFGAIAEKVAKRALGFDIKLLACDPYRKEIPEEFKGRVALCDKDRLLAESDIISAHLPLNEETRHILSYREIAKMKRGSFLINTSRGGIVDEQAVADALSSGLLAGAAFDVLEKEPLSEDCPVAGFENVVITSHIGMYSQEAIHAVSMICAENAAAWKKKRPLRFELV